MCEAQQTQRARSSNLSGQGKYGKKQLDPLIINGIRCKFRDIGFMFCSCFIALIKIVVSRAYLLGGGQSASRTELNMLFSPIDQAGKFEQRVYYIFHTQLLDPVGKSSNMQMPEQPFGVIMQNSKLL